MIFSGEATGRLSELSRQAQGDLGENSAESQQIVAAAELLGRLLLQDVERTDDGVKPQGWGETGPHDVGA